MHQQQYSLFLAYTVGLPPVDTIECTCAELMMASKTSLFGGDIRLSLVFASDYPQEQKHLERQGRHECEAVDRRGNLVKFAQNEEIRVAVKPPVPAALPKIALMTKCGTSV